MSMICTLQAYKDADLERVRRGDLSVNTSCGPSQTKESFPLGLYLIEIFGVLYILAGICHSFSRFWYIWLLLALGLLGYLYIENKRLGMKQSITSCVQSENELCIDKAWHGIGFLLTGSAWEGNELLNFLVSGGEPIEGTDSGYGEDRLFTSDEVKKIDEALQGISKEDFESRFDSAKMMKEDIYPTIWDRPKEEDDTLGYISEYFGELKRYIHRTCEQNMGMIVGLS